MSQFNASTSINEGTAVSSVSFKDLSNAEYAGNGKHLPKGYLAFKAQTTLSSGDVVETQFTLDMDVGFVTPPTEPIPRHIVNKLAKELCKKYPLIAIDDEILGEPRLAGTRFAVSNVLTALIMNGSFEELIEEYDGRYTEEQLKEAVKFARDFLDSFYRP